MGLIEEGYPGTRIRRRRTRRQKKRESRLPAYFRRMSLAITLIATAAYIGAITLQKNKLDAVYGRLSLGMDTAELRYAQGAPTRIEAGRLWVFADGQRVIQAQLDKANRVEAIACVSGSVELVASCPLIGPVATGSTEVEVKEAFGPPSTEAFIGHGKVLTYTGLGLTFQLDQGAVMMIRHTAAQGGLSWLGSWLWLAMP